MSNSNNKENLKGGLFVQSTPKIISLGSSLDNLILLSNQAHELNNRIDNIHFYSKDTGRVLHSQTLKPVNFKDEYSEDINYNDIKLKVSGKKDDVVKAVKIIKNCSETKNSNDSSKLYHISRPIKTDFNNLNKTLSEIPPFYPTNINFYDPMTGAILHKESNYESGSSEKYYCDNNLEIKLCGDIADINHAIKCLNKFKNSKTKLYSWDDEYIGTSEEFLKDIDNEPETLEKLDGSGFLIVTTQTLFSIFSPSRIISLNYLSHKNDSEKGQVFGGKISNNDEAFNNAKMQLFFQTNGSISINDNIKEKQLDYVVHKKNKIYILLLEKQTINEIIKINKNNNFIKNKKEIKIYDELVDEELSKIINVSIKKDLRQQKLKNEEYKGPTIDTIDLEDNIDFTTIDIKNK